MAADYLRHLQSEAAACAAELAERLSDDTRGSPHVKLALQQLAAATHAGAAESGSTRVRAHVRRCACALENHVMWRATLGPPRTDTERQEAEAALATAARLTKAASFRTRVRIRFAARLPSATLPSVSCSAVAAASLRRTGRCRTRRRRRELREQAAARDEELGRRRRRDGGPRRRPLPARASTPRLLALVLLALLRSFRLVHRDHLAHQSQRRHAVADLPPDRAPPHAHRPIRRRRVEDVVRQAAREEQPRRPVGHVDECARRLLVKRRDPRASARLARAHIVMMEFAFPRLPPVNGKNPTRPVGFHLIIRHVTTRTCSSFSASARNSTLSGR